MKGARLTRVAVAVIAVIALLFFAQVDVTVGSLLGIEQGDSAQTTNQRALSPSSVSEPSLGQSIALDNPTKAQQGKALPKRSLPAL